MLCVFEGGKWNASRRDTKDVFMNMSEMRTCGAVGGYVSLIGCPVVQGYREPIVKHTEFNETFLLYIAE